MGFTLPEMFIPILWSRMFYGSMYSIEIAIEYIEPFTQIYSTGVARVPTVVSAAFYYRLDVCNLCKQKLSLRISKRFLTGVFEF
jgi:hypothetical protein